MPVSSLHFDKITLQFANLQGGDGFDWDCVRHHALSQLWRFPEGARGAPIWRGSCATTWYLRPVICGSGDLWGLFSPPRKSRFPATDTTVRKDSVRRELLRRKPEHLVLAGPFGRQVGEADNSHAMRKASFDRSLDEIGREE